MKIRTLPALAVLCALFTISCSKEVKDGYIPGGQILLSFDDNNTDNWNDWLPLLDSSGIKATFYISSYHTLTQVRKTNSEISGRTVTRSPIIPPHMLTW
jgi:peptidoglycan/xylan/chitin deacetylase (PgdA/CDA1 family)